MYDFHKDRKFYFDFITKVTEEFIIPFINLKQPLKKDFNMLEIGCAEGGAMNAFVKMGIPSLGIELDKKRVVLGNAFMETEVKNGMAKFISRDIYDIDVENELEEKFDLIVLKDVIEHIFNQEKFFGRLGDFLKPNGQVFFGFPPWYMPFGGHQQVLKSKLLSKLPYFHLFPAFFYKFILKTFNESPSQIKEMLEIKETGLSIERFEKLARNSGFKIVKKDHYLINPVYKYKFGLKPRKQFALIKAIPFFRNFLTTGVYYLITKEDAK